MESDFSDDAPKCPECGSDRTEQIQISTTGVMTAASNSMKVEPD